MDSVRKIAEKKPELVRKIKRLPHAPGIYIYRDAAGAVLYVGKAVDLRKRVVQYITRDDAVGPKTLILVRQIADLETIKTASEFDAMLLEARLIFAYQPKYNVIAKDDKSPLYIKLTLSETLPHIIYVRKPRTPTYGADISGKDAVFGPFQSAKQAKQLMRTLRRVVPYCTQKKRTGKPCFYTHIGLCMPCPSYISKLTDQKEQQRLTALYRRQIFRLRDILSGKSAATIKSLETEMTNAASAQDFEKAAVIRNQLQSLYNLMTERIDPMQYIRDEGSVEQAAGAELATLSSQVSRYYPGLTSLHRIECVDISNTMGTFATGSLVVLTDGIIDTASYRRFRIKRANVPNDVAMIAEVVRRRFGHAEWSFPDLFVVDGGKSQVRSARNTLRECNLAIAVIGLAKRREEIIVPVDNGYRTLRLPLASPAIRLLQRLRDEAHRFAITYHRQLRSRSVSFPDKM